MYNPGSIADRIREYKREVDAAYARLSYVHNLLGESYSKIHKLEKDNLELRQQLESMVLVSKTEIPLVNGTPEGIVSDTSDNTEYQIADTSDNTKGVNDELDTGRTKKIKRNSA